VYKHQLHIYGWQVLRVCMAANPRLGVRRARFSALIAPELHRAMQNLVRFDGVVIATCNPVAHGHAILSG
jgi:hypothetical protein